MQPVPLRTDYLANLGQAYGQGMATRANVENTKLDIRGKQAQLDVFYQDQQFSRDVGEYVKANPDKPPEDAASEFALKSGRVDKALEYGKAKRERTAHTRNQLATFADLLSKANAVGGAKAVRELGPKLGSLLLGGVTGGKGPDINYDNLSFDGDRFVREKRKDGSEVVVDSQNRVAPIHIPAPKTDWRFTDVNEGGKDMRYAVDMTDPNTKILIGNSPVDENGQRSTAFIKNVEFVSRVTGASKAEAVQIVMNTKTMTREQFLMEFAKVVGNNEMLDPDERAEAVDWARKFYDAQIAGQPVKPKPGKPGDGERPSLKKIWGEEK